MATKTAEQERAEDVLAILAQSDAVCDDCGADPRTVPFGVVCDDWYMEIVRTEDDEVASVRCPDCW